jgi:hypothetical protein
VASVELQMTGRSGHLVYVEGARRARAYIEVSGVDEYHLLVWTDDVRRWADGSPTSADEQARIRRAFARWAKATGTRCQWWRPGLEPARDGGVQSW